MEGIVNPAIECCSAIPKESRVSERVPRERGLKCVARRGAVQKSCHTQPKP